MGPRKQLDTAVAEPSTLKIFSFFFSVKGFSDERKKLFLFSFSLKGLLERNGIGMKAGGLTSPDNPRVLHSTLLTYSQLY